MWKHFVEVCKKCIFLDIPKCWGFKKSSFCFMGNRIHFVLKIGILEIVKNRFSKQDSEIYFFEENCDF